MQIAVIGAGPIGLEAALAAQQAGHQVTVYEAGGLADHVRAWADVRLFTPWHMLTTERGRALVDNALLTSDACPTGGELVERYLLPLAAHLDVRTDTRVVGVARTTLRKGQALGSPRRAEEPFQLLVRSPEGTRYERAEVVADCTGVLSDPVPAGLGGLPAPGEGTLVQAGLLRYGPVPVRDLGGRVLLVGNGSSAATQAIRLHRQGAALTWLTLGDRVPGFVSPSDDPLPVRKQLYSDAASVVGAVRVLPGRQIVAFQGTHPVRVALDDGKVLEVDAVVVCNGYRPDLSLHRELQVHSCWGSEGPMKLAAALLAQAGGDCLGEQASGADLLKSPEPLFFVLGAKSYGRRSDFLLQTGHRQIEEWLTAIAA